jgi:hypothetical protein
MRRNADTMRTTRRDIKKYPIFKPLKYSSLGQIYKRAKSGS